MILVEVEVEGAKWLQIDLSRYERRAEGRGGRKKV